MAQGMDRYVGFFRKGLPNGNGKYEWNTGEIYVGDFKIGLKHRTGKMEFVIQDPGKWMVQIYI